MEIQIKRKPSKEIITDYSKVKSTIFNEKIYYALYSVSNAIHGIDAGGIFTKISYKLEDERIKVKFPDSSVARWCVTLDTLKKALPLCKGSYYYDSFSGLIKYLEIRKVITDVPNDLIVKNTTPILGVTNSSFAQLETAINQTTKLPKAHYEKFIEWSDKFWASWQGHLSWVKSQKSLDEQILNNCDGIYVNTTNTLTGITQLREKLKSLVMIVQEQNDYYSLGDIVEILQEHGIRMPKKKLIKLCVKAGYLEYTDWWSNTIIRKRTDTYLREIDGRFCVKKSELRGFLHGIGVEI